MKRFAITLSAVALGLALTLGAQAQNPAEPAAAHYKTLGIAQPSDTQGKIEVIEFFWYGCNHCHAFDPDLQKWVATLPKDVVFKRVPVQFNPSFEPQQRLFYTLEAMGKLDSLHTKFFHAIHQEKQKLNTAEEIEAWVVKQGIDKAKFVEIRDSMSIGLKVSRAAALARAYRVDGVPLLAVGGRFLTAPSLTKGDHAMTFQVANQLIEKSRKAK